MQKKYKILIHGVFWIYILNQILLIILMMSGKEFDPYEQITIYPATSVLTFYAIYFSYALIFRRKNKLLPVIILIAVIALLIPLRIGIEFLFWKYIGYEHLDKGSSLVVTRIWWINSIRLVIIYGIYALLIKLTIEWFEAQKIKSALVLEKQASELSLLRYQINPHFLFNTLNNIYALVYQKSDEAPEAVMKMSAIMRYVLNDSKNDRISLEKEIDYLNSYIELEKLRIREKDFVTLLITGEPVGKTIAPMLLIPFIENAFKHGNKNVTAPGITIRLQVEPDRLVFRAENYLRKDQPASQDLLGGIGLENIRRRLNLSYPGKHDLAISCEKGKFIVNLTLFNDESFLKKQSGRSDKS